jgi:DNA-binding GntR family transcriptional regulator
MLTQFDARGLFPVARPLEAIIEEHVPVVRALEQHDGDAAFAALTKHLERAQLEADDLWRATSRPVIAR